MKKLLIIITLIFFVTTGIYSQDIVPYNELVITKSNIDTVSYVPIEMLEKTVLKLNTKFSSNFISLNKKYTFLRTSFQEQLDKQKTINEKHVLFKYKLTSLDKNYIDLKSDFIVFRNRYSLSEAESMSNFHSLVSKTSATKLDISNFRLQLINIEEKTEQNVVNLNLEVDYFKQKFDRLKKRNTSLFIMAILTTAVVTYVIIDELRPIIIYR